MLSAANLNHRQEDIVKIAKQNTKAVLLSMQNSELQLRTT